MTYYCYECDDFFEEEEAAVRRAVLEDDVPMGSMVMCCPYCGGREIEEASKCLKCGRPLRPEEQDFCPDCVEELDKDVEAIIDGIQGDALDARQAFFDYLERRWL